MTDWSEILDKRIAQYKQALQLAKQGEQHNPGPWPVAEDVPLAVLQAWIGQVPGAWKLAYNEHTKATLLYGDPSPPHARTAGWFMMNMAEQIKDVLGPDALGAVDFSTETIKLSTSSYKTPDFAVFARSCKKAIMVVEVGYHCEQTFQDVTDEVNAWSQAMHPVVIGVKITDNAMTTSIHNPRIELIVRVITESDQVFHLGQGSPQPCLGEGTHIIKIPAKVFDSVTQTNQQSLTASLQLDLFSLQEDIMRWVLLRDTHF